MFKVKYIFNVNQIIMEVLNKMPTTVLEHVKGSELPAAWLKKIKADPPQTFTVTLEPEAAMPPEDRISDELIKAVKKSEESIRAGKGTFHQSTEELFENFDKIQ